MRGRSHDWTECPFAHPGEKARRRDPRRFHYGGTACPDFRKGACRRGDGCEFAHGVFECWLHPARYRTQPCKDGTGCKRRVCFFAHTKEQLRLLPGAAKARDLPLPLPLPLTSSESSNCGSAGSTTTIPLPLPLGMSNRSLSLNLPPQSVLSPTSTLSPPLTPDLSPSRSPRTSYSSPSSHNCSPEEQLLAHWNYSNGEDNNYINISGSNLKGATMATIRQRNSSSSSCSSPRGGNNVGVVHGGGNPYERFHHQNPGTVTTPLSPQEMAFLESQLVNNSFQGGPRGRFGMVSQAEKMSELLSSLQALEMGGSPSSPPPHPSSFPPSSLSSPRVWAPRVDQNLNGGNQNSCGGGGGGMVNQSRLRTAASLPASLSWMEAAMREETMAVGVERVESGRDLRAKIYGSLEGGEGVDSPDFSWVGDLVESSSSSTEKLFSANGSGNGNVNSYGNGCGNMTTESGNSVGWNGGWNGTPSQENNAAWC